MTSAPPRVRPRLVAERVAKTFRSGTGVETAALADFSLHVANGEFVSIVGPSGCGKTTFLNCVAGLMAHDSGTLTLDGRPIVGPGPERAVVFQDPSLLPWRTVRDNVAFGMVVQKRTAREEQARRVADLLRFVGLEGFERHYPSELSGGMRQRVNLARALATSPELLLMDEPFGALDAQTREQLQVELCQIWQRNQVTVLFVTHDIEEAIFLSDRVAVMTGRPGRLREVVVVDLPRPRAAQVKRSPEFVALEQRVWNLLHDRDKAAIGRGVAYGGHPGRT